jgi:CRP-like cAMP-binding protein
LNILTRKQAEAVVRSHGWLSRTSRDFQDLVLAKCDLLRLKPTQNAYEVGDQAGGLFGVARGRVEMHLPAHGLEPTLSYIGGPGYWVGDAAAVSGRPRVLSVIAASHCQLLRLPRAELQRLGAGNPAVWANIAMLLAASTVICISLIDALKRNDPVARVAATLVVLLDDLPNGAAVLDISQSDLASIAHLGRVSVNAALKELQSRGWIRRRYGSIELTKPTALRHFAAR